MKVKAKCHNYSGCLQAYRGEEVELESGAPLVCPECGKPLALVKGGAMSMGRIVPIAVGVVVIGLAVWLSKPLWTGDEPAPKEAPKVAETTPKPEPPPVVPGEGLSSGARPAEPTTPPPVKPEETAA